MLTQVWFESGLRNYKQTGIESQGWFRASDDTKEENVDSMMMSRLCALHWIIVLYESVVPDVLKADVSRRSFNIFYKWLAPNCTPRTNPDAYHRGPLASYFFLCM